MILKEMVYGEYMVNQMLAMGTHKGHDYVVKSYGTHPCCYVSIPNGKAVNTDDIYCHGGVTWSDKYVPNEEPVPGVWWIGWDYSHCDDRCGMIWKGKEWTAEELEAECIDVIDRMEVD